MTNLHRYTITQLTKFASDVYQVQLIPINEPINFKAGQYINLVSANGEMRPYSIANAPNKENRIELHIRYNADLDYMQQLFQQIKPGTEIQLQGAFGNNFYKTPKETPIILLAGGTGFAPCKAIMEQAIIEKHQAPISLYWGVRQQTQLYFDEIIKKNFHCISYHPMMVQLDDEQALLLQVTAHHPQLTDYHAYAFGPIAMAFSARDHFIQHGLPANAMFSDAFDWQLGG